MLVDVARAVPPLYVYQVLVEAWVGGEDGYGSSGTWARLKLTFWHDG